MCRGPRQGVPRAFVVMGLGSSRLIIAVKWDSVQPLKSQTSEKCAQLWGADAQCERRVHSSPGHAEQGPRSPWCSRKQRVELRVEKGRDVRGACRWVLESRASLSTPQLFRPAFLQAGLGSSSRPEGRWRLLVSKGGGAWSAYRAWPCRALDRTRSLKVCPGAVPTSCSIHHILCSRHPVVPKTLCQLPFPLFVASSVVAVLQHVP